MWQKTEDQDQGRRVKAALKAEARKADKRRWQAIARALTGRTVDSCLAQLGQV